MALEQHTSKLESKLDKSSALGSILGDDLISLRILLAKSGSGIDTYQSLQQYGTLRWEIQRLLWIGYKKNINNSSCPFSQLPKDVIKCIIKFFLIDENNPSSTIVRFDKNTTFKDIANRYQLELDKTVSNYLENDKWAKDKYNGTDWNDEYPIVHLWCQLGCIKKLYSVKTRLVTVTEENVESNIEKENKLNNMDDCKRWVEIPDDWLKYGINFQMVNITEYNWICIEFLSLKENSSFNTNNNSNNMNNDNNSSDDDIYSIGSVIPDSPKNEIKIVGLKDTPLYWPLAKYRNSNELDNLQIGDMVDVIVECYKLKLC